MNASTNVGIDLLKLRANFSAEKWNQYLYRCLKHRSMNELFEMQRRLQVGMNNLAKNKMNTTTMQDFYLRLLMSVERTIKQIWRKDGDNKSIVWSAKTGIDKENKDKSNIEIETILRKKSY